MVGGSSRLLQVREMVQTIFNGKALNFSVNADEAIAIGAAIYAGKLNGDQSPLLKNIFLLDVTPLTRGVEVANGELIPLIKRSTPIPFNKTHSFTTAEDN
jgi:molecular chaperone DnaK